MIDHDEYDDAERAAAADSDSAAATLSADLGPTLSDFRSDVVAGLSRPRKAIPCKYLYDERGSQLFDRICETPEYYPTRTELGILLENRAAIGAAVGPRAIVIEPGAGSGLKIRLLLGALESPCAYVPMDISGEHLAQSAASLAHEFPGVEILPVRADFLRPLDPPPTRGEGRRRVVFFPGSTIGNYERDARSRLLRRMRQLVGRDGLAIIGVDLVKDRPILEAAYNDAGGVTAAFTLNLLDRINRELDADFDPSAFAHRAHWDEAEERIEINLVSRRAQTVRVGGRGNGGRSGGHHFTFATGETIHTEYSHKFRVETFSASAAEAGLRRTHAWLDDRNWFAVTCFVAE